MIILIIIAGGVVALVLLLKKDKGDNEDIESDRTKVLVTDNQFIKPKNTIRKYELIELEKSKYKFILIEDPKSFNGGVEIRANLGFDTEFEDGFAHFAEHIFFGGNEKVTEFDLFNLVIPFDEIIDAYTAEEETVFLGFGSIYTFSTLLESISSVIQNQKLNIVKIILILIIMIFVGKLLIQNIHFHKQ